MQKIESVKIGPIPTVLSDFRLPKVITIFEDGEVKEFSSFYPDELSFRESEFVGLTEREANDLFIKKDVAYLRS